MRDMEVSSKQWRGKEPLWTPPSIAPLGCDRQAVCRTHWEITTHLLWLSARVSDEQRRPLADANCRGVEVGVWVGVRGGGGVHGRRKKCKEREKESAGREVAAGDRRMGGLRSGAAAF